MRARRWRAFERDLPHDFAGRANDKESRRAASRTRGVEAERRNVDVAVRPNRKTLDAALYTRCRVRQHREQLHMAAMPCVCWRRSEKPHHERKRAAEGNRADIQSFHVFP